VNLLRGINAFLGIEGQLMKLGYQLMLLEILKKAEKSLQVLGNILTYMITPLSSCNNINR
jgi:hypothetical protein